MPTPLLGAVTISVIVASVQLSCGFFVEGELIVRIYFGVVVHSSKMLGNFLSNPP